MPTFKARIVAEITTTIAVEAEDAFDAMDASEKVVRKMTVEEFTRCLNKGHVRASRVEETKMIKRGQG